MRRPVLALVVSTLILLLGLRATGELPVRQYPLTENTTITITTQYPGASPELMQGFVTQPIAQAVATVENIDYLSSSSTQGRSLITVRMKLNADSNKALSPRSWPRSTRSSTGCRRRSTTRYWPSPRARPRRWPTWAFSSKTMPIPALTDYLQRVELPQLSSIDGVASVDLYGGQTLAMRVWLDPAPHGRARHLGGRDRAERATTTCRPRPARPRGCTWYPTSRSTRT